jgi:starch phosphorylase
MKAQANGVLNVSSLDGWWDEAWQIGLDAGAEVGWAIGKGESYTDPNHQDQIEAEALYELLEREIVPSFYERRADGLPRKWIDRMKTSIIHLCPEFNMHRMVMQYAGEYYLSTHRRNSRLQSDYAARSRSLASWLARIDTAWPRIEVRSVSNGVGEIPLGDHVQFPPAFSSTPSLPKTSPYKFFLAASTPAAKSNLPKSLPCSRKKPKTADVTASKPPCTPTKAASSATPSASSRITPTP